MPKHNAKLTKLFEKDHLRIDEYRDPVCGMTLFLTDEVDEQTIEVTVAEVGEILAVLKKFHRKYKSESEV